MNEYPIIFGLLLGSVTAVFIIWGVNFIVDWIYGVGEDGR